MKMFNTIFNLKITAILILFLGLTFTMEARDKDKDNRKIYDGYVVTVEGDTIEGSIELTSPADSEIKVKFFTKEGEQVMYKAKQLQEYAFLAPVRYNKKKKEEEMKWIRYTRCEMELSAVPFGAKDVLVHEEVGGAVSLYNYYVERPRTSAVPLQHFLYLKDKEGKLTAIDKKSYRKVVKNAIKDYPELAAKVGKEGYRFAQLNKTLTEYNEWAGQ